MNIPQSVPNPYLEGFPPTCNRLGNSFKPKGSKEKHKSRIENPRPQRPRPTEGNIGDRIFFKSIFLKGADAEEIQQTDDFNISRYTLKPYYINTETRELVTLDEIQTKLSILYGEIKYKHTKENIPFRAVIGYAADDNGIIIARTDRVY